MIQRAMRLRRAWATTVFVLIAGMFVLTLAPPALAWDDCPKGMVNDPYPGACSRYVDTNNDGICDLSQPEPAPSTTQAPTTQAPTTQPAATTAVSVTDGGSSSPSGTASTTTGTTSQDERAATVVGSALAAVGLTSPPSGGAGSGGSPTDGGAAAVNGGTGETASPATGTTKVAPGLQYNLSPIAAVFFLIYLVSFVLYRTRRMRVTTHRKIWNVLLLLTFLLTGVLGMLLVVELNYGVRFRLPFNMLFWHVETGIVMSLISFFHIGWHLKYYRNLLRRRHDCRDERAAKRPASQPCRRTDGSAQQAPLRPVRRYAARPAALQAQSRPLRSVSFEGDAQGTRRVDAQSAEHAGYRVS